MGQRSASLSRLADRPTLDAAVLFDARLGASDGHVPCSSSPIAIAIAVQD